MGVFDFARVAGDGSGEEGIYEFAAQEERMAAPAVVFRCDCPLGVCDREDESAMQQLKGYSGQWWTIDGCEHGRVQAAVENSLKADLDGTELSALGGWINGDASVEGFGYGFEVFRVGAGDDDDLLSEWLEGEDCGGEERACFRSI